MVSVRPISSSGVSLMVPNRPVVAEIRVRVAGGRHVTQTPCGSSVSASRTSASSAGQPAG